jgi:hypothetical protein
MLEVRDRYELPLTNEDVNRIRKLIFDEDEQYDDDRILAKMVSTLE